MKKLSKVHNYYMKKILLFYLFSGLVIRVMNDKFPGTHESGIGLGSLSVLIFYMTITILIFLNIYKYFKGKDRQHLMLGGLHLLMLLVSSRFVNGFINGFEQKFVLNTLLK